MYYVLDLVDTCRLAVFYVVNAPSRVLTSTVLPFFKFLQNVTTTRTRTRTRTRTTTFKLIERDARVEKG